MLATSLVALALAVAAQAGPALKLTLSGNKSFSGVDKAVITATLTNVGDEAAKLLNEPNTVLSKMETNTFAIANVEGMTPKFVGKIVKYVPTVNGEATTLAPGESVTVSHDLSSAYDFRRTGAGDYSFETSSSAFTLVTESGLQTIFAETEAHEAKLAGELYKPIQQVSKRATYTSCTSARQTSIAAAIPGAQSYVANAYAYLVNHTATSTRYTTWFGTWTSARRTTVLTHYSNLNSRAYSGYTYDCSCTDSAYAYTYASTTGQMWFCNAYWSAPTTGTDSKAGTMVHESTHWSAIAGTGDYAYGQSAAKSLAISSPAQAVQNADSHEYFAENNPALS
ncbi:deuterolysin M35 metalloprotease [Auriculariales sp. MPI-PUGE-AT-0066]|nr:deuterolysin M35 metalloprotease [Auriculariales sp. MPI-PUGE-AT-0066]